MSLMNSLLSVTNTLQTTQAQIQITSNNISNLNTEGYTRKTAQPMTQVANGQVLAVELSEIQRTVNEDLLAQIREHISLLTGQTVRRDTLDRTQDLFGTLSENTSISHELTELSTALEALANSPNNAAARGDAVEAARRVADRMNVLSESVQDLRSEAETAIGESVERVNTLVEDIHDLNGEISLSETAGRSTADLRDQRDVLLRDLAEEIDIKTFERGSGEVVVSTAAGRTLLDSVPVPLSHVTASQLAAGTTYLNGIPAIVLGAGGPDITLEITGGRIGGLLTLRDETLVDLQAEIDRLAETLRDQVNAAHNNTSAFPAPSSLTGSHAFAAADAPSMTGSFRVTIVDAAGAVVETQDIALGGLANVGALVTAINGMTNATASLNANGQLVVTASAGNGVAVNELDGTVTTGNRTYGMGDFLGLNDVFQDTTDYDVMISDRFASDTTALGLSGTLTFSAGGAATPVAYAAGDDLTTIAANITAALGGANVTATVVREADGYRLEIRDANGDNLFVTDSGILASQFNLRPGESGTSSRLSLDQALSADSSLLGHASLSGAAGLAVGDIAVSLGDATGARALADAFTTDLTIASAGGLPTSTSTLAGYAAQIISLNAANANALETDVTFGESFRVALETQSANISQVNLDEELANLVVFQNAFSASARLTTTIIEMLDTLLQIGR